MRLRPLILLLLAVLTICPPSDLTAQTATSGALAGVVTDRSGAVVTGADVAIEDLARGTTQSTRTDREGAYRFFFLVPGKYALTVTDPGFREGKHRNSRDQ